MGDKTATETPQSELQSLRAALVADIIRIKGQHYKAADVIKEAAQLEAYITSGAQPVQAE